MEDLQVLVLPRLRCSIASKFPINIEWDKEPKSLLKCREKRLLSTNRERKPLHRVRVVLK
jgi:hypothetical protein